MTDPLQDLRDPVKNDYRIVISRTEGKLKVEITGMPLPRDVSVAQKALTDHYRVQRRILAKSFSQSRRKFQALKTEVKVAQRELQAQTAVKEGEPDART